MDITATERISRQDEQESGECDGDTPMPDATKEMGSELSNGPGCISSSRSSVDQDVVMEKETVMSPSEWKNEGNVHFGKEDWEKALLAYHSGLAALFRQTELLKQASHHNCLSSDSKLGAHIDTSHANNTDALEIALRSNISFVLLKLQQYVQAEGECSRLLSISPHNSKALYRRACAREGIYFSIDKQKEDVDGTSNKISNQGSTNTIGEHQPKKGADRKKSLLNEATDDLQKALLFLQKELNEQSDCGSSGSDANEKLKRSNTVMMRQCRRSLDRLRKEYDRQENKFRGKILKSQQKQDVLRLLLARFQSNGESQEGEAFFLLEWNWWVKWCRYVDFFQFPTTASNEGMTANPSERAQKLLTYLPPGATFPLHLRKEFGGDDDDDDSSDDEDTLVGPGSIDNSKLLVTPDDMFFQQWYLPVPDSARADSILSLLKPNLIQGYHYEILPREVYSALRSWYGEKTPSLCRRITKGSNVVLYPPKVSNRLTVCSQKYPRCNACRAPGPTSRCKECMMVQYCGRTCQESHWRYHRPHCGSKRKQNTAGKDSEPTIVPHIPFPSEGGRVGLNNLGNTCFMNAALQSLSHAIPLTRHFLSNRFKSDLNSSNPLGTGGKLALAYEVLLKDIWMKTGITSTSPTALKRAIALFAPRFAGYHQHDAQEFLAYLLDGLHEDLNRIRRAPYVEMPDVTDGQNMTIASAEAWNAHKRRNDSLVMDTFYGQFKSTCICPRCNKISVSFDAFNHVSLEIPSSDAAWATVSIPILVHFGDSKRKPIRYGVTLPRNASILDLKKAASNLSQIPVSKLILTDVYENTIYKLLDDKQGLSTINPNEDFVVAYEVTPYTVKDTLHMIVTHSFAMEYTSKNPTDTEHGTSDAVNITDINDVEGDTSEQSRFGLPFMTSIDAKNSSCSDLWGLLCGFVRRFVTAKIDQTGAQGIASDSSHMPNNCQMEDILAIHVVDAQGRPRLIFESTDSDEATDILPSSSEALISSFLGEDCAENFLFLKLTWNNRSKQDQLSLDPKQFLEFDSHPTLEQALRQQKATNTSNVRKGVSLDQCFQSFSTPERLDINNMWYCSKCRQHVQALKTMQLWRLPNILVVHLKRFEFKNALRRDKLGTFVDFPLAGLDMSPHCARVETAGGKDKFVNSYVPAEYDLFAVVNHYGRLGFGHYTAFAMQWDETGISKEWNAFDDSNVHQIQPSEVQSSAAYILFYRRRVFH